VKSNSEAVALCKVLSGQILLEHLGDQERKKTVIEDVEKVLDDTDGITSVHGRYYRLASQFYRLQGKYADYYRTALRYLRCVRLSELSQSEREQHAYFLGLAALLGEGVLENCWLTQSWKLSSLQTNLGWWTSCMLLTLETLFCLSRRIHSG
jgi:26S proteasome regulatory subunit N9